MRKGNDEREAIGDVPNIPGEMREFVVIQHIKEVAAKLCLVVTGGTISASVLVEIDVYLRIALSVVGLISGTYALLYYRRKYKNLMDNNDVE